MIPCSQHVACFAVVIASTGWGYLSCSALGGGAVVQTRECGCMQEAQIDATLKELDIDLIVLARYMQAHPDAHT